MLHMILLPNGKFRESRTLRWLRTIAYGLIGIAGVLLIVSPVFRQTTGLLPGLMAGFLAVGGTACCYGCVTHRWVGEFTGLPLLASSFVVFGILSFRDAIHVAPYIAFANLSLLTGFAIVMMARWRVVLAVYQIADRFKGDPE